MSNVSSDNSARAKGLPRAKWGPVGATLTAAIALVGGQIVGFLLVAAYAVYSGDIDFETALNFVDSDISLLFASYLAASALTLLTVGIYLKISKATWRDLGFRKFRPLQAIGLLLASFIGFLLVAAVVSVVLETLMPGIDLTGEQEIGFLDAATRGELFLTFVALVVIAPITEEIVFRGLLLPAYARWFGIVPAVLITSVMFALLHPPLSAMITIGVFALFLAGIYVRTQSLWPAILLHSAKNLVAYIGIFMLGGGV